MRLLITNDDGINSYGLHMLVREMEKEHEVVVVAPEEQKSACGHSVTIHKPMRVREVKIEGIKSRAFSVNGTPADCVKIAMEKLLKSRVDMVLSGINQGLNIGTDVIYSGTVSAAIESSIYKIPSMAVSMDIRNGEECYSTAAVYAKDILKIAQMKDIKNDFVLNVNVPWMQSENISGIKICNLGNRIYTNCYIETMENGEKFYELNGNPTEGEEEETDVFYVKKGYITVTPLHYDLTNFKVIKEVADWFKDN